LALSSSRNSIETHTTLKLVHESGLYIVKPINPQISVEHKFFIFGTAKGGSKGVFGEYILVVNAKIEEVTEDVEQREET